MKWLVAIPVFNEAKHVVAVMNEVRKYADDILAINDGSSDGSGEVLFDHAGIHLINHKQNLGYGAALRSAFGFAQAHDYDVILTMDADVQQEAAGIPCTLEALTPDVDMVSGSRYLQPFRENTEPPADRRRIN